DDTDGHLAAGDGLSPEEEHDRRGHHAGQLDDGWVGARERHSEQIGVEIAAVDALEACLADLFAREGLHHPDPGYILLEAGRDLADGLAGAEEGAAGPLGKDDRG